MRARRRTNPWRASSKTGWRTRGEVGGSSLREERQRAAAAVRVDPVLLDEEVAAAERHVGLRAVGGGVHGAEGPGALVGVLIAAVVVPGVEVGIADRFL